MIKNKNKNEIGALNQLMLGDDEEREVLHTFGLFKEFKVYAPNEDFQNLMKEIGEKAKKEGESYKVDEVESIRVLFIALTNFEEDYPELLEEETFKKMCKKPKRVFERMCEAISQIASEEVINLYNVYSRVNKMNDTKSKLNRK